MSACKMTWSVFTKAWKTQPASTTAKAVRATSYVMGFPVSDAPAAQDIVAPPVAGLSSHACAGGEVPGGGRKSYGKSWMRHIGFMKTRLLVHVLCVLWALSPGCGADDDARDAAAILDAAGARQGLCIHLGCGRAHLSLSDERPSALLREVMGTSRKGIPGN